jgi:hypothetical protein
MPRAARCAHYATCDAHVHGFTYTLLVLDHSMRTCLLFAATRSPCTQQQLISVVTAADPTAAAMGMIGSAPACTNCFVACASETGAEKTACGMACGPAAGVQARQTA